MEICEDVLHKPAQRASRTMRAMRIVSPRVAAESLEPMREPGPGEVRIRLEGCGVCASNIPPWEGKPWFQYPMEPGAPGHEGWGRIDALGEGVTELRIGDRVAFLSGHAYAEFDIANASESVRLPGELDGIPFPGEPLGCAMNIFMRSGIRKSSTVAIVGIGYLGAVLCRLASQVGARVIALSRREYALEIARHCGAHAALSSADSAAAIKQVGDATGGEFCDVVIEATGKQGPLDLAAELTRVRGRLLIAGYHQDGPRQVNMQLWNWRGLDVINAHERNPATYIEGMREAVRAVMSGLIDPVPLLTHRFKLDQLGEALDAASQRPEGFMKAYVEV